MYSTNNLIALAVVAIGLLLVMSPETLISKLPDNSLVKKVSDNSQLVGLALIGGGGYYFWSQNQGKKSIRFESYKPDDIATLTGSEI